jgi:hypothetical protein
MRFSAFVVVALLAACTGPSSSPAPAADGTPRPPSIVLPAEALPVPDASPWPIRPGDKHDHASSPDVAIGKARSFTLYTHCGIDFRVDFDESFWQSYLFGKSPSVGDPVQKGTMTLLSDDVAVFRYESNGGGESIYFVRNDTPRSQVGCY